jgi:hypothetical protein
MDELVEKIAGVLAVRTPKKLEKARMKRKKPDAAAS